jgi:hypothetical protein
MRRGIPAAESSRKDLDMQRNRDLLVTIAKPLADVSTSLPLLHALSMSLSLPISPSPRSVVSSMKQEEVEELLQWVEELEQAEAWLLGKQEAAEKASSVAARGGASAASVFFSYIF